MDDLSRWILDSWFYADCKLHQGYSSIYCLQQSSWHPLCLCAIKICSQHETKMDDYLCQLQCRRFHLQTIGFAHPSHALHKGLQIYSIGILENNDTRKKTSLNEVNLIQTYVSVDNILVTIHSPTSIYLMAKHVLVHLSRVNETHILGQLRISTSEHQHS